MKIKLFNDLQIIIIVSSVFLFLLPSCGDEEKDEPEGNTAVDTMMLGKWLTKTSGEGDSDYWGLEFNTDGPGVVGYKEEDLYLGTLIIYNLTLFVTSESQERLKEMKISFNGERSRHIYKFHI